METTKYCRVDFICSSYAKAKIENEKLITFHYCEDEDGSFSETFVHVL